MLGHAQLESTAIYAHVSILKLLEVYAATHPAARIGAGTREGEGS
jgi:site-specific recombinase XerD